MIKGRLVNKDQSFSVEVTLPDSAHQLLENSQSGSKVDIELFANECEAVSPPRVAIRTPYEHLVVNETKYKVNDIKGINQGTFLVVSSGTILILNVQAVLGLGRLAS